LFPEQVVQSLWFLGHSPHDEGVGREMPALVAFLVENEQVAADVDPRVRREVILKELSQVDQLVAAEYGFAHRRGVRGRILNRSLGCRLSDCRHAFDLRRLRVRSAVQAWSPPRALYQRQAPFSPPDDVPTAAPAGWSRAGSGRSREAWGRV